MDGASLKGERDARFFNLHGTRVSDTHNLLDFQFSQCYLSEERTDIRKIANDKADIDYILVWESYFFYAFDSGALWSSYPIG